MNQKLLRVLKIVAIAAGYSLIFIAAMFLTMSLLIKGEEISTPNLTGQTVPYAYKIAARHGVYLKRVVGEFGSAYQPHTVVSQFPAAGTPIKEKSVIKIFVSPELAQVIVPDMSKLSLKEAEELLVKSKLRKGAISYISVRDVPVDSVLSQARPSGTRLNEGAALDLLVSRGAETSSYIMPDLIGQEASRALVFFESNGLKIAKIENVAYFGLKPGVIIKQFPPPGYEISIKNQIGIQVSK
jgi:eukaryotic-like serine/threonine-protein kinase